MEELSLRTISQTEIEISNEFANTDSNIYHYGHVDHIVSRYPESSRTPYGV